MNNYEPLGIVGEGAYGIVLKCVHKTTKETVAIKKFKDKDTEDSVIKKVIVRELKGLRSLKHPCVINLKDAFRQNDRLYLVFEYCEKSLLDLLNVYGNKGMPINLIKSITYQVLKAIQFMHEKDFLHRDIKPENILLTQANKVKICDFGFCRMQKNRGQVLTDYVATRWYRSPELLITPRYDKSVDIWALGCVIGEMISGDPLFPGDNLLDQLSKIYNRLGKLPELYHSLLKANKETSQINFDELLSNPDEYRDGFLRNHYFKFCKSDELIDLLEQMLDLDFTKRITAFDALNHPFFHDLQEYKEIFPKNIDNRNFLFNQKENVARKDFSMNSSNAKSHTQLLAFRDDTSNSIHKIDIKFSNTDFIKNRDQVIPLSRKGYLPTIKHPVKHNPFSMTSNSSGLKNITLSKLNTKLHQIKK
jgi:cyclin-dependent kinase-like